MIMANQANFQPTEIWTPGSENFDFGEAIEDARRRMNSKNPERLIYDLKKCVHESESGIVYAILRGEHPEEYSGEEAIVMFNPFANTATANMLVRAEFIREVAKSANIYDEKGKLLKPVIMLASPGIHGSHLRLTKHDRRQISRGELGPAAKEYLKTVSALEFGHVALLGYSQGSDMAIAGAKVAQSANLDAGLLSIGDPAGVTKRSLPHLAQDFFTAAPDIEKRAVESGLAALDQARSMKEDYRYFLASSLFPINWHGFARGMGSGTFEANMQEILNGGKFDKVVVGYGENSTIAVPSVLEPSLARLHEKVRDDELISIKVSSGTHAWGEQLTVLAKLYLMALA